MGAPKRWPALALGWPDAGLGPRGGQLRTARRHRITVTCRRPHPRAPHRLVWVHPLAGMYATASGWGASPAQQLSNVRAPRGKAHNSRGPAGAGGLRGRAAVGGRGGGGGRSLPDSPATPSGPPSARAITERADCKYRLQAKQAAIQVDPQGNRSNDCVDCVNAGRNPHHFFRNCAFSECRNCKRGGHPAAKRPFPAFF